jgi:hypothetical protein
MEMLAFQLRKQSWLGEIILAPCSGLFPQLKRQRFNVFELRNQSWTGETILAPCSGLFPQLKRQHFNVVPANSSLTLATGLDCGTG